MPRILVYTMTALYAISRVNEPYILRHRINISCAATKYNLNPDLSRAFISRARFPVYPVHLASAEKGKATPTG
jgi:hypothetical protein